MEMRSTFHLKFHMHYFKATLFQYGENQKILMGPMMLFRKREIKNTKKQKDVAHVVTLIESHLYFTNRKRSASTVFTLLFVTRKRKVGHKVPIGQNVKASAGATSDLLTKWSSNDAQRSTAPLPPAGFPAISTTCS